MAVWRQKRTTWLDRLFNVEVIPVTARSTTSGAGACSTPAGAGSTSITSSSAPMRLDRSADDQ